MYVVVVLGDGQADGRTVSGQESPPRCAGLQQGDSWPFSFLRLLNACLHFHPAPNSGTVRKEAPDRERGFPGAWVIRFDKKPNEMKDADGVQYSKERPNPVLAYLK